MRICLFIFMFLVSLSTRSGAEGIWSFSPYGDTRIGPIPTERKVTLSYAETENIIWQVDNQYCKVESDSSAETVLTCAKPGVHRIVLSIPSTGEVSIRYIKFWNSCEQYSWNVAKYSGSSTKFQVWIVDLNETPVFLSQSPTQRSVWITKQLATTGQVPEVEVFEHGLYESHTKVACDDFNVTEGNWLCTIGPTQISGCINLLVHGRNTPLIGFSVRDVLLTLNLYDVELPTPSSQVVITTATVVNPYIVKSPNIDGLAAWVDSAQFLVTTDSFRSTWSPVIPATAARTEQLVSVAFTWTHLVILTNAHLYFLNAVNHTLESVTANTDITAGAFLGGRGYDWASRRLILSGQEHIVAWTSDEVYLIKSNGSVTQVSLSNHYPNIFTNPTITILDAAFTIFGVTLGILAKLTEGVTNKVYIFITDLELISWSVTDLTSIVTDMPSLPWHLAFRMQAYKSILIWSDHNIIGCRGNMSLDCALLEEQNSGDTTFQNGLGDVYHVAFSQSGDVIFATTKNVLFYSKISSDIILKVLSGELTSTDMAPYFDPLNHLFLVTADGGGSVSTRMFPLDKEVFSAAYPNRTCQVLHFTTNINSSTYFLDMRGELNLWATVLVRNAETSNLQLISEGAGEWNLNVSSSYQSHKNLVEENMTLTVYHNEDYTGATDYITSLEATMGHIHVEFAVSEALTCPPRRPAFACIAIGCPPLREVRVLRENNANCAKIETFITKEIENGKLVNKIRQYDWAKWGCPTRVKSGRRFVPSLGLFDDGEMIEKVPVDFIMWEKYDQPNIEYNTTMAQAGCRKPAQTWQSMISLAGSDPQSSNVWGPQNYEPCFTDDPSRAVFYLSQSPYQIFNSSNFAALKFSAEYDGIYIFTAKIVDPNYSFCSLAVEFAVEVYGTIPPQDITLLVNTVMSFIGIFMTILILSYARLRRLLIREQYEEEQEALLQQSKTKFESYKSVNKSSK